MIQNLEREETEKSKGNLQIQHLYYNVIVSECIFSFEDIVLTCHLLWILGFKKKDLNQHLMENVLQESLVLW